MWWGLRTKSLQFIKSEKYRHTYTVNKTRIRTPHKLWQWMAFVGQTTKQLFNTILIGCQTQSEFWCHTLQTCISISASTWQSYLLWTRFYAILHFQAVLVYLVNDSFHVDVCCWVTDYQLFTDEFAVFAALYHFYRWRHGSRGLREIYLALARFI